MEPRQHEGTELPHRVGPDAGPLVDAVAVGDAGVAAVAVELPAVEGADELVALDVTAVAEVGAEVRAVRVVEVRGAVLVAPHGQVAPEVVAGQHVADP